MSPFLPLACLLIGTASLSLGLLPRFRYAGAVAIWAAAAALVSLAALAPSLPQAAVLSEWSAVAWLPVQLTMEVDGLAWLFCMALVALALAALLTGVARPGGRRLLVRGAMLLLTFASVAAVMASNLPTRIMAWAGLDLVYFLALVLLTRDEGLEPQAVLNLALNMIGSLLAVAAALTISRDIPVPSLRQAALSPESTVLLTLAVVFRLGLFPAHLGLPAEANIRQGLGTLLRLFPAAVGLEVVSRIADVGFAEPVRPWLTVFGVAAALLGAVQLWVTAQPRLGLTYVVIAQSGLVLSAGLWGVQGVTTLATTLSLGLVLGGGLLYLASGYDDERPRASVLSVLGALGILGAPLTAGFVGLRGLHEGALAGGPWVAWLAVVAAEAVLAAGLWRVVFWPGEALAVGRLQSAAYYSGLAVLAVLLVLGGVLAGPVAEMLGERVFGVAAVISLPTLVAVGLFALTAGGGFGLWRREAAVKARADVAWFALSSLFRVNWLYRTVWSVIRSTGAAIYNLAEVLEGEGALLWALVVALSLWMLVR